MKWISVKDRLPNECDIYLVYLGANGNITYNHVSFMNFDVDKKDWYNPERWSFREYVTHWMPLPEPPKE